MKRLSLLLGLLLMSVPAGAVETSATLPAYEDGIKKSRWYFGMGAENRMTKQISSDIEHENKTYPSVFAAYKRNWFQTLSELNWFDDSSQAGAFAVEYSRIEFRQWLRGMLYPKKTWSPHFGLSIGTYKEEVKTEFNSFGRTDRSDYEFNTGAEIGIQGIFYDWLFSEINFRTLQDVSNSEDLTDFEEWSWSLQLRLGFSI